MCVYIATLFDYNKYPPTPLQSMVYDKETGEIDFYTLLLPKTGKNLYKVFKSIEYIKDIIESRKVVINDFKSHIETFKLSRNSSYDVHNLQLLHKEGYVKESEGRTKLAEILKCMIDTGIGKWQKINADSQVVYQFLEDRGIWNHGMQQFPRYDTNTLSGRSRTTGFNIQGTEIKDDIRLERYDLDYFIHFDWIAADLRVASILSNDSELSETFRTSDPYTEMANDLGSEFDRDVCKIEFLKSIYSLDIDNPILELYPTFLQWMKESIDMMKEGKPLHSILGKPYAVANGNERSVFSGIISGSVAHAMQSCIARVYDLFPDCIVTETHDSITMMNDVKGIKTMIKSIGQILLHPFEGILDDNQTFPLRVYVGRSWKDWKFYKELR